MDIETDSLKAIRDAIDAAVRFGARGCSGMMCDRVRGAWIAHQLGVIGRAAIATPDDVREEFPDIPWDRLVGLVDEQRGLASMTGGELDAFLERDIPRIGRALRRKRPDTAITGRTEKRRD